MDNEKVPDWALERAKNETDKYAGFALGYERIASCDIPSVYAFARYIAEHEEPPVDPLLIEAREIAATQRPAFGGEFRSGSLDATSTEVPVALAALRRGIELARKEDSHAG